MKLRPIGIYLVTFVVGSLPFVLSPEAPESALEITSDLEGTSLPDDWRTHNTRHSDHVYELALEMPATRHQRWALMVPAVRQNARVYLNGHLLGDGGRFDTPVARNARRPLFFALPSVQLLPKSNVIKVHVRTGADAFGFLSSVYAGPEDDLRGYYNRALFFRGTVASVIEILVVLVSFFFIVLWVYQRRRPEYAYFGFSGVSFALYSISFSVVNLPVSEKLWELFVCVSLGGFALLAAVFYVHRVLGRHEPRFERSILAVACAILFALCLSTGVWVYRISYFIWSPFCALIGCYGLLRLLIESRDRQGNEVHWIAASGSLGLAYGLHDVGLFVGVLDWSRGQIVPYAISLVIVWHGFVLLSRLVTTSRELETLNVELEHKIEERTEALQQTFDDLRESEEARVLSEERQRIMADMHDGVGGQLVSALTIMRSKKDADADAVASIEYALDDLRLTIDSMDIGPGNVGALLQALRERFEASVKARGIALHWEVGEVSAGPQFNATQALHLLRILQECFSNALKHSNATEITLRANNSEDGPLIIDFLDNGQGIDPEHRQGRGLRNMQRRARDIGATLEVESRSVQSPNGTLVRVVL